ARRLAADALRADAARAVGAGGARGAERQLAAARARADVAPRTVGAGPTGRQTARRSANVGRAGLARPGDAVAGAVAARGERQRRSAAGLAAARRARRIEPTPARAVARSVGPTARLTHVGALVHRIGAGGDGRARAACPRQRARHARSRAGLTAAD